MWEVNLPKYIIKVNRLNKEKQKEYPEIIPSAHSMMELQKEFLYARLHFDISWMQSIMRYNDMKAGYIILAEVIYCIIVSHLRNNFMRRCDRSNLRRLIEDHVVLASEQKDNGVIVEIYCADKAFGVENPKFPSEFDI